MPYADSAPVNATVTGWEHGTDLVIDTRVDTDPQRIWSYVADPQRCARWFAPWRRADEDTVELELDDEVLVAHILACEPDSHVLFDTARLGRLGLTLTPVADPQPGGPAETRIALAHTFPSVHDAADAIAQVGPVWETHLRMLCDALGQPRADISEGELYARYARLAADGLPEDEAETGPDEGWQQEAFL
ncbi:hypothetical protein GSY69_01505 [Brevibacterium sp. 5221]|uniref:ATPase n=1 Tax=Brevibacterium rongguiense TaxID=2695267 RepID=A0A6N9H3P8_9MICO|nr:hypothetical protein [Brevibacterium rongguiense]MYM18687.1 hypothetical protein [Brevibacterium rongguiense]